MKILRIPARAKFFIEFYIAASHNQKRSWELFPLFSSEAEMKKTLILLSPFFFSAPAFALTSMVCKMGKIERKVEIRYPEAGKKVPCQVVYVREGGEEKVLYTAQTQAGYCQEKATEFAGGLVERGFACSQEETPYFEGPSAAAQSNSPAPAKSGGDSKTLGPMQGPSPSR